MQFKIRDTSILLDSVRAAVFGSLRRPRVRACASHVESLWDLLHRLWHHWNHMTVATFQLGRSGGEPVSAEVSRDYRCNPQVANQSYCHRLLFVVLTLISASVADEFLAAEGKWLLEGNGCHQQWSWAVSFVLLKLEHAV